MQLWTAQYRYSGENRLDITVKGQDPVGVHFAPTWDMVMRHKRDGNDKAYIDAYHTKMLKSYKNNIDVWEELLSRDNVVIVCFCHSNKFCHRFLLSDYLVQLGATYRGEINIKEEDYNLPF